MINMYFDHIQQLAPPPEEGEYNEIQSVDPRRRKGAAPEAFTIPSVYASGFIDLHRKQRKPATWKVPFKL